MPKMTNKEIQTTYAEYVKVNKELATLEERKAYLKTQLLVVIPENGAKAGVFHTTRIGSSVSWKAAADSIITTLVPSTKRKDAQKIVKDNTKETKAHIFKAGS